jgi:hypothetical protein
LLLLLSIHQNYLQKIYDKQKIYTINLQEFQLGTDPNDYYEGRVATLTWLGTEDALGPDDSLSVRITDASGQPMVNAPVELTAKSGGHKLIYDALRPSATIVLVRTDAQGIATVYVESKEN